MVGYSDDKTKVLARLRRIEGQVRGLQRMVDDDVYCIEVLTQISAATMALQAVALTLLEAHLGQCVEPAVVQARNEASAPLRPARARLDLRLP